jgi:hypothetical protein
VRGENGASAPSPSSLNQCAEPGCRRDVWASRKDRRWPEHSIYCFEHASTPMFDAPPSKSAKGALRNPDALFRKEVERQREQRS